jgi:translation initiation factor IF-3
MKREDALALAKEKSLDLIEIAPGANPPVARIMSFDKFRYHQEKEEKKHRNAQRQKELKQVQITPRSALNDLQIKARKAEEFLKDGHKVTVSLFLRGREKANKEWALKKMREFISMITVSHEVTMEPKQGGRGYIAQIAKK